MRLHGSQIEIFIIEFKRMWSEDGRQTHQQDSKEPKVQEKSKLKEFFIDGKMRFVLKQQTNSIMVLIELFLLSLVLPHTLLARLTLAKHPLADLLLSLANDFYLLLYILMILHKILLLLSVYLEIIQKEYVPVLSWLNKKVLDSYPVFKQADLALTAFLCLLNYKENLFFFILSATISLSHAIHLQNYVIRKDITYIGSASSYFLFRCYILLIYTSNIILSNLDSLLIFNVACLFNAIMILLWYFISGYKIYEYSLLRKAILCFVAASITISARFIQNLIIEPTSFSEKDIAKIFIAILVISFSLNIYLNRQETSFYRGKNRSVKDFDLYLSKLIQLSYGNIEHDAELVGLIRINQLNEGQFQQAKEIFYDPHLKYDIKTSQLIAQKQSHIRLYIRQIYDKLLSEDNKWEQLIDFCEFLCNYDHNYCQTLRIIAIIRFNNLNIFQRVRINRIQNILKESNAKLNQQLYSGKLQIEHIIDSQECFIGIEKEIRDYIQGCLDIWGILKSQQISLQDLREQLQISFKSITKINQLWKKVYTFLRINHKWNFIFSYYQHFIKNQKAKQRFTDLLSPSTHSKIFDSQPIYISPDHRDNQLFNSDLTYHDDSLCLNAVYHQEDLIIKMISKRFMVVTGYTEQEINGSSLGVIMEEELGRVHQERFEEWVKKGYPSNQGKYVVRGTEIVTKRGEILPALKYFKIFCGDEGVQFFCLLKINQKHLQQYSNNNEIPSLLSISKAQRGCINEQLCASNMMKDYNEESNLERNIFIKEETLQPVESCREIEYFKIMARLFILMILGSLGVLLVVSNRNMDDLAEYSKLSTNYLAAYRYPMFLSRSYLQSFLNIGDQISLSDDINKTTAILQDSSQLDFTKMVLFDRTLNPSHTYYPQYSYSFLEGSSQNQIDLFYLIASSIASLSHFPINRTGQQYQRFSSYLMPAYSDMMNNTKFLLQDHFRRRFIQYSSNQTLVIVIQAALSLAALAAMFCLIHSLLNKIKNTLFIFLDLNQSQVHEVIEYWQFLKAHFRILSSAVDSQDYFYQRDRVREKKTGNSKVGQPQISLNKKAKQINEDVRRRSFQLKLRVVIVAIIVVVLALSVSIEANIIVQLKELDAFREAGFFYPKYSPLVSLMQIGCLQKFYHDLYPNELNFRPEKYRDSLASLDIWGSGNNYIGVVNNPTSAYEIKQKKYFFGNLCEYNPDILINMGLNFSICMSMANGTLKEGGSAYLRYAYKMGYDSINNKVNFTQSELEELILSGTIYSAFVSDAIDTWGKEFIARVEGLQGSYILQTILIGIFALVIHVFIKEVKIMRIIQQEYQFIRNVYLNFVPQSILINQKVIKQKFIIEGIINP